MYYLHSFIAFSARSGSISLDMWINKVLEKNKTYLFQSHVAHVLHHNSWLQPGLYESWENLL